MVQRKPTPEEQLLKLIENPAAAPADNAGAAPAPGSTEKKPAASPKKWALPDLGKFASAFSYFRDAVGHQRETSTGVAVLFDIKWINRFLLALLIAAVLYFLVDTLFFKSKPADILTQVGTSEPVYPSAKDAEQLTPKELSFYQEVSKRRNPFLPPGTAMEAAPAAADLPTSAASAPRITEVLQGLKLVGISWGPEPLAMIEDVATNRTYFLRKDQEVRGVKIQEIGKEKVTVTFEGEEGELF